MELGLPRKNDDRLMHTILNRRKLDDGVKSVENMNSNPPFYNRSYEV